VQARERDVVQRGLAHRPQRWIAFGQGGDPLQAGDRILVLGRVDQRAPEVVADGRLGDRILQINRDFERLGVGLDRHRLVARVGQQHAANRQRLAQQRWRPEAPDQLDCPLRRR